MGNLLYPTEQGLRTLSSHLGQTWLQVCRMRVACVCTTCTPPALKHGTSIQTQHSAKLPNPCPLFYSFFPRHCAWGGIRCSGRLTRARGARSTWCGPWEISGGKGAHPARVPISVPFIPSASGTVPDFGCFVCNTWKIPKGLDRGSPFDIKPELTDP